MDKESFKSELGLLGLLGYRVGNDGRLSPDRKKLLKRALALPIFPDVKQKVENWEEWGEPSSKTRCEKLMSTLSTLADNATGQSGKEQAVKDWRDDLEYVRTQLCKE